MVDLMISVILKFILINFIITPTPYNKVKIEAIAGETATPNNPHRGYIR